MNAAALVISSTLLLQQAVADTNAVERALGWLRAQQRSNGSWSDNVALNALPMLAMLSAGQIPGVRPYDSPLDRGLRFLLRQQAPDGAFTAGGGMMYGHALATLLLAEAAGMTGEDRFVRPALQRAVTLILRAQAVEKGEFHAGGWRYEPTSTDSDLSITVWQVIALRAASETGIPIPREAFEQAARYIKRCEHPGGGFGYQPGGIPNQSRTAGAILALQMCGRFDDPAIERARRWLRQNPLRWDSEYFYHAACHTAHAGAGFDAGLLLQRQQDDGSWPAAPHSPNEARAGPLYSTSMAVIALTARRNFLPVFMK
ncbi:MAG: terpene cyclase/mutase family protein [Verrucomicrobiae bacterium]|nr:terpene cyclase/mutase family protein [Verrucomicrobiae bacterium]